MTSVLQAWVMDLPLREQATLLTAVRGCDDAPKDWGPDGRVVDSPSRRLTAWVRWTFMVAADPREIGLPGAFLQSAPPATPFHASALGHLPLHWYSHVMHALEVVGYRHPDKRIADTARGLYGKLANALHLPTETRPEMILRLGEDRIKGGTVVS